jgi:hypothetical protein
MLETDMKIQVEVIDEKKDVNYYSNIARDYNKYRCIRNISFPIGKANRYVPAQRKILSTTLNLYVISLILSTVMKITEYSFLILIPLKQKTLEQVAEDLISDVKGILRL